MTMNTETVKSPCIGVCAMDELTGLCHGCYRTLDEITGWWDMTPTAQKILIAETAERQMQLADFGD